MKKVAEMTGRRKRYVKKKNGYQLESRDSKQENLAERFVIHKSLPKIKGINLFYRDRFQKGEKVIAVISDAASMVC